MRHFFNPESTGTIAASFIPVSEQVGGVVRLWEVASGKELRNYSTVYKPCQLRFSPDGKFLACTVAGEHCVVWDVATGKQIVGNIIGSAMAFFPDGKMLVTCMETGMSIWETATCKKLYHIPKGDFEYNFQQVAISADGHILAVIGNAPTMAGKNNNVRNVQSKVYLWHVDIGKQTIRLERSRQLIQLPSHWANHNVLAFSPDDRTLATSDSSSPIIHVWEIATGKERCRLNSHHFSSLSSCSPSFSPDGRRLATGHHDTTILIWDLTGRSMDGRLRPARLSVREMEARWHDLARADAAQSAQALWSMVAAGSPTVSFLKTHLQPIRRKPVTAETLNKLIVDLDNSTFAIRKKAREELKKLGEAAEASLRQALDNKPSLELRRSIEELLKAVEEARSLVVAPSPEVLRSIRAIEVLEQIGTPEAQQLLKILSRGAAGARQTLDAQAALLRLQQVTRR